MCWKVNLEYLKEIGLHASRKLPDPHQPNNPVEEQPDYLGLDVVH